MSTVLQIQDFDLVTPGKGGANERVKGDQVRDDQSAPPSSGVLPLKNCHTDEIGSIVKRNGYTLYSGRLTVSGSPTINMDEVNGMFQYKKFDGSEFEVVSASDSSAGYLFDISTPATPSDITGSASLTTDSLMSFAVVNDTLIITTDDRDTPLKWTGSGNVASLGGTPPVGKFCAEFENYAFIANTSANPERVFFSSLADPETWVATDFIRLNGECTGLISIENELFAFTRNSITVIRFTGDSVAPFSDDQLNTRVGTNGPHSLLNLHGTLYWMAGDNHIYRLINLQPQRVTEVVPITMGRLNTAVLNKCVSENHVELRQAWFHCALDESTTNDFVVVLDYINDEVFFYDGINANSVRNFVDSSGAEKTYFGDRTGRIYLTNTGNSDNPAEVATAIDFFRYTKQFNFGAPSRKKRIRNVRATVNNQGSATTTITVEGDFGAESGEVVTIDHDAGDTTIGDFEIGTDTLGGIEDHPNDTDVCTTANYVQLKVANAQLNVPVKVRDITMRVQGMRRD